MQWSDTVKSIILSKGSETPGTDLKCQTKAIELRTCLQACGESYLSRYHVNESLPYTLLQQFQEDIYGLNRLMSVHLAETAMEICSSPITPDLLMQQLTPILEHDVNRLGHITAQRSLEFSKFLALQRQAQLTGYLYLCEKTKSTCFLCESAHDRLYSLEETEQLALMPPRHPHCRCKLVAVGLSAQYLYHLNQAAFLSLLKAELKNQPGGVYLMEQCSNMTWPPSYTLIPLELSSEPTISDGTPEQNFGEPLKHWSLRFGADAGAAWSGFWNAASKRGEHALKDTPSFLDWLTIGVVSGTFQQYSERYEHFRQDPTLYSVANWFSSGLPESFSNTLQPKEPLSFAHWMSSLETVLLLFGGYQMARQATAVKVAPRLPESNLPHTKPGDLPDTPDLSKVTFTDAKLQHEFKHAPDFGVYGSWNKANGTLYKQAIQQHIGTAPDIFLSTYRGNYVYVFINPETSIGAYVDLTGNYIGGCKFSTYQINYHILNGERII